MYAVTHHECSGIRMLVALQVRSAATAVHRAPSSPPHARPVRVFVSLVCVSYSRFNADTNAGNYCPTTGMQTPSPCPAGHYCNGSGVSTPAVCPQGSFCVGSNTLPQTCTPGLLLLRFNVSLWRSVIPVGFALQAGTARRPAPPTKSHALLVMRECSLCSSADFDLDAGSYCPVAGLINPKTCASDHDCRVGVFLTGSAGPVGSYCSSTGAQQPSACTAGVSVFQSLCCCSRFLKATTAQRQACKLHCRVRLVSSATARRSPSRPLVQQARSALAQTANRKAARPVFTGARPLLRCLLTFRIDLLQPDFQYVFSVGLSPRFLLQRRSAASATRLPFWLRVQPSIFVLCRLSWHRLLQRHMQARLRACFDWLIMRPVHSWPFFVWRTTALFIVRHKHLHQRRRQCQLLVLHRSWCVLQPSRWPWLTSTWFLRFCRCERCFGRDSHNRVLQSSTLPRLR